ncbi:MAG: hypothetical protein JNJ99_01450, partial [Crocinitomicaceae bacterium]|nr:hypothetical protein [Crocinitomicaceae bacterium]
SICVDSDENVFVTGTFSGTVDFDPGSGTANLLSSGSEDIFILKLDSSGNFIWAKKIGGTASDIGNSIMCDSSDNVILGGAFRNSVDFDPGAGNYVISSNGMRDAFMLRLSTSGTFLSAHTFGSTDDDICNSIKISDNAIYFCGQFSGTVDFDSGLGIYNLTSNGTYDIFVAKCDLNGSFLWGRNYNAFQYGQIAIDNSENVYVTGDFIGTVDFDPGLGVHFITYVNGWNGYVLKLDSSGIFVWAKAFLGGDNHVAREISIDESTSDVLTWGLFFGTVDFDPNLGSYIFTAPGGDNYLSRLDSSGNFIWVKKVGDSAVDLKGLSTASAGEIYCTGSFVSTTDFDETVEVFNLV